MRVECPDFLEKLECAQISIPQNVTEEGSSWDMVSIDDLWEDENVNFNKEDYEVDMTLNQLQEALSKTFSVKKEEGKVSKEWDGSKIVHILGHKCHPDLPELNNPSGCIQNLLNVVPCYLKATLIPIVNRKVHLTPVFFNLLIRKYSLSLPLRFSIRLKPWNLL